MEEVEISFIFVTLFCLATKSKKNNPVIRFFQKLYPYMKVALYPQIRHEEVKLHQKQYRAIIKVIVKNNNIKYKINSNKMKCKRRAYEA